MLVCIVIMLTFAKQNNILSNKLQVAIPLFVDKMKAAQYIITEYYENTVA